ncbi:hypothetical protein JCM11491_001701 [Sporobolomyces phaffii]
MASEYQPLPSSCPSTPPSRSRPRSFNRASPPESLTLSPSSLYSYTESEAFLSPRTRPVTPESPYSFFHPSPSPARDAVLLTPLLRAELEKTPTGYFELKLPPTAKRTRKAKLWLAFGGAIAIAILCFAAVSIARGPGHSQVEQYSTKVLQKVKQLKETVSEKWSGDEDGSAGSSEDGEEESQPLPAREQYEPPPTHDASSVEGESGPLPISLRPELRSGTVRSDETRYIGFLPHSGVHNQRIALENALLLGKLLGRAVLVPPIWIGWPTPTEPYDDLAKSWTDVMLVNPSSFNLSNLAASSPVNLPANYSSTVESFPCPTCAADDPAHIAERVRHETDKREKWLAQGYELRPDGFPITELTAAECKSYSPECRHTYRDTFMSYDFLVDLDRVRMEGVEIVDRWDMREKAVEDLLGVEADDIYVIKDRQTYDFLFTDANKTAESPLISPLFLGNASRYNREVSLPTLAALPHKVLLFGSLFGGGRIQSSHPEARAWSDAFARAMAFDNEWLLRPADAIVARMGGPNNFVGVHARVGDGDFARHAKQNMENAWKRLVEDLGYDDEETRDMWEAVVVEPSREQQAKGSGKRRRHSKIAAEMKAKRSAAPPVTFSIWSPIDTGDYSNLITSPPSSARPISPRLAKRTSANDDAWSFLQGPSREPSALLRKLNCRSPLHTHPNLKALNVPLYLATDSRSPTTDPNLRPFFDTFPCTFVLSDFDRPDSERNDRVVVESVGQMSRLENELDRVPLGRLFLPFLEAIVAAKGKVTVGTAGSTFSSFATGALHDAYHDQ